MAPVWPTGWQCPIFSTVCKGSCGGDGFLRHRLRFAGDRTSHKFRQAVFQLAHDAQQLSESAHRPFHLCSCAGSQQFWLVRSRLNNKAVPSFQMQRTLARQKRSLRQEKLACACKSAAACRSRVIAAFAPRCAESINSCQGSQPRMEFCHELLLSACCSESQQYYWADPIGVKTRGELKLRHLRDIDRMATGCNRLGSARAPAFGDSSVFALHRNVWVSRLPRPKGGEQ